MIREDEILYKIDVIIRYLKEHKGYDYKLYNRLCPDNNVEPDSNIVEYAFDVLDIVKEMFKVEKSYKYEKDYYLLALKKSDRKDRWCTRRGSLFKRYLYRRRDTY